MKNQVLTIEQMQHLKELGVDTSKASLAWWKYQDTTSNEEWVLSIPDKENSKWRQIPTFTLQDMLEMISNCFTYEYEYKFMCHLGTWYSKYMSMIDYDDYFISSNTNPLTCAYETLCWLAEKEGLLKVGEK